MPYPLRRPLPVVTGLLLALCCRAAPAQTPESVARVDRDAFVDEIRAAAEHYVRDATRGGGHVQVTQSGYLQARRYYAHALLLTPDDAGLLASRQVVEQQLARYRRQHRWELLRSALVGSVWGSPLARSLHDGSGLGLGRASFDVEADRAVPAAAVVPRQQWTLRHSRRRLPFLIQLQAGLGYEDGSRNADADALRSAAGSAPEAELLGGHASAELDYTVLPLLSYLLPYVGVGYHGMLGFFDDDSSRGDYYLHGSFARTGVVLSLGRAVKLTADYSRSLTLYGSHFSPSGNQESLGLTGVSDCYDSWSATQLSLEFLF